MNMQLNDKLALVYRQLPAGIGYAIATALAREARGDA